MNNCCKPLIEPCHSGECDGFNEVVQLLPQGQIWNPDRGGVYGAYIQALGHIKTELNKIICQEWNELNPCSSKRLFGYWAEFYKLPPCIEQTGDKLCEWIDLLYNQDCPIGSLGFLRKAIEFVLPNKGVEINVNLDSTATKWRSDDFNCADNNSIIITAPSKLFKYYEYKGDFPHTKIQDGVNLCRRYFIPEIECLRACIFPMGLSVGYKTKETGEFDINNIDDIEKTNRPINTMICNTKTGEENDRIC